MEGAIASTALTLLIVPLIYYMLQKKLHDTVLVSDPGEGAGASGPAPDLGGDGTAADDPPRPRPQP